MTNTRGYHFWRINNVLTNSRWRWIDRSSDAGCVQKRRENRAIHICLRDCKNYMTQISVHMTQGGEQKRRALQNNQYECGVWVGHG